jgi:hypothetical protein
VVANESLKGAPTDALTFEAWIRTNDDCNDGTLLSYAIDPSKCARAAAAAARAPRLSSRRRRYPGDDATDNEFTLFSTREMMARAPLLSLRARAWQPC